MKIKGHKLTLSHNGEKSRDESSWTASCICGWEECHSRKDGAQQEYRFHLNKMKRDKENSNTKGAQTIGITKNDGETWRECVKRYGEDVDCVSDMLAEYDLQVQCMGPSWAALKACWDYLACDEHVAHRGNIKPLAPLLRLTH